MEKQDYIRALRDFADALPGFRRKEWTQGRVAFLKGQRNARTHRVWAHRLIDYLEAAKTTTDEFLTDTATGVILAETNGAVEIWCDAVLDGKRVALVRYLVAIVKNRWSANAYTFAKTEFPTALVNRYFNRYSNKYFKIIK